MPAPERAENHTNSPRRAPNRAARRRVSRRSPGPGVRHRDGSQGDAMSTQERLAEIANWPLTEGSHSSIEQGMCVMEAVAYVAGESWTDRPRCVSPTIAAFMRSWNDSLPDSETRSRL